MNNNSIFDALNNVDDRHIRAEELAALDSGYSADSGSRKPRFSKKIFAAMVAAAAAASLCVGASAGAAMAKGFIKEKGYSKDRNQPTISFSAANAENCPETIGQLYLPSAFPEGVDYSYHSYLNEEKTEFGASYYHVNTDMVEGSLSYLRWIRFRQTTKADFTLTFNVPGYVEQSETTVNGCPAYLFVEEYYCGSEVTIIWDSGDYIMKINCLLPVNEAMRLAESVAARDNVLLTDNGGAMQ